MGREGAGADADEGHGQVIDAHRADPGVDEVTEGAPSLLVLVPCLKLPPKTGLAGMFEMVGVVGVAWPTVRLWGLPSAAA